MPVSSSSNRMPICEMASIIALQRLVVGKDHGPQLGQQQAEHRRPQQHAGQQLAEQRRLAEAVHAFAEHAADQQQQDQLGNEDCQSMVGRHALPPSKPTGPHGRSGAICADLHNGERLSGMQPMDKEFMQALARRAGLDKALAEFPDDVAAAAAQAASVMAKIKTPADPRAEPWPAMRAGDGL